MLNVYRRVTGDQFTRLNPSVQDFHHENGYQGRGAFTITHGRHPVSKLMIRLMSLPEAGVNVPVHLTVSVDEKGETWQRKFGKSTFVTHQCCGDSVLLESVGPIVVTYELRIDNTGALVYRQKGSSMKVACLSIPLPRFLSPTIDAKEWGTADDTINVVVSVTHQFLGMLIKYEGAIMREPI